MKLDRLINFCLRVFGRLQNGEPRACVRSQNLHGKETPNVWLTPQGRLSFRFGTKTFRFSWNLLSRFCSVGLTLDAEDGLHFNIAFPPVSLHLTLPISMATAGPKWVAWNERYGGRGFGTAYQDFRVFEIRVFNWALWWEVLKFDWGWSHEMPKWMSGNFNFLDFLLGSMRCETSIVETRDVVIPMPEGVYPAKAKLELRRRFRARWFSKESYSVWLDIPQGIPHQGKGENSWDCVEDGIFGIGAEGKSYERAIAHAVEESLVSRRKYGLSEYPNPASRPPPTSTSTVNGAGAA